MILLEGEITVMVERVGLEKCVLSDTDTHMQYHTIDSRRWHSALRDNLTLSRVCGGIVRCESKNSLSFAIYSRLFDKKESLICWRKQRNEQHLEWEYQRCVIGSVEGIHGSARQLCIGGQLGFICPTMVLMRMFATLTHFISCNLCHSFLYS